MDKGRDALKLERFCFGVEIFQASSDTICPQNANKRRSAVFYDLAKGDLRRS